MEVEKIRDSPTVLNQRTRGRYYGLKSVSGPQSGYACSCQGDFKTSRSGGQDLWGRWPAVTHVTCPLAPP